MPAHPSLSVVLPVYNAESVLACQIANVLDILPDLTSHFEVLIVDNGSTDHTADLAHELAREYPQVRVVKHLERRGQADIVQTGLAMTIGEILVVQDENAPMDWAQFHELWAEKEGARKPSPMPSLLQQLVGWNKQLEEQTRRLCWIRRTDRPAGRSASTPNRTSRLDSATAPAHRIPSKTVEPKTRAPYR